MDELSPASHAEAVAVFRHGVIGALTQAELDRGQLSAALSQLATQRFRPPGADATRGYSVPTLERWYYAFRKRGLAGLTSAPRGDRGRAQDVAPQLRELLCDIRREHPSASVALILRTLVADGRMQQDAVSASTVRRLFRQEGLDRVALRDSAGDSRLLAYSTSGQPRPLARWLG